ncbi:TolC family outer membrane protein [Pseudomaricurvus sp. HS19]|uniref:TolC family outer membrane protein n=1 Tax=Pseudomaricurvus sp. HS19 TaxID=2692626 RepID=UPI0013690CED|nr:TolC family outer membrane protein [Pseudomaricurvus sp. HS19]MYM63382.1 TolC family outer membrane protein [Pseudomaricurvus sp. HS19]
MLKRRLSLAIAGILGLSAANLHADTLQDIYQLALEYDHQLKADEAAFRAAQENITIGRAGLLPQINGSARYSETDGDAIGYQSSLGSSSAYELDTENEQYALTLTQPLFNMAAWFGYKQSKTLSAQAEAQFSADQQSFIVRVTEAYFNVLRAIDATETARAEETAYGHQLEQTKQRFEVGLTAITDVHEAQAAYDTATASTLEAQGNLGIAFEQLEVLTGSEHTEVAPLVAQFAVVNPQPATRSEWVDFALENNYQLKVARFQADAAQSNARAKASNHLPTLTASYNYVHRDDTNTDIIAGGITTPTDNRLDEQNTIAVELNVPIFSGLRVSGERRQAYEQQMQAEEIYNLTQRNLIQNARSLHLQVVTDVAQVRARKQAIISGSSALEATQAGYEVGTRNLVDVLVAQRNLYQAQRNYDNSRYDYVINMLRLKQVAGNLSPEDVLKLNQWLDAGNQVQRSKYQ